MPRWGRISPAKATSHVGLLVLVAGAPLAIGCVHPPAILAAGALAAIAFAALLWRRRETERRVRVPALGWVLLAVTGFVALQCVPLPASVLRLIAPAAHRIFTVTLGDLGLYGAGSWRPLSLDPAVTVWEALKLATITATFLLATNIDEKHDRRAALLGAIGAAGLLVMLVGIVQVTLGTSKIYGLFAPWSVERPGGVVFTTFINPNHSAAFLGMATAAWVGLAAGTNDLGKRLLCAIAAIMCTAGIFLSVSRGGIAAFAVGQICLMGLLLGLRGERRRREEGSRAARLPRWRPLARLWLPVVLAGAVGVGLWLAYEPVTKKFASLDATREREVGRPKVWRDALPMLRDHAAVGIGRGAFATAFPRYQQGARRATYTHLENEYLQLPVDLGLPVGAGLLLAIGLAAFGWLRRCTRGPHRAAAVAALVGLAVHAFTDFNLEVLGVALAAAALAGLLAASTPAGALSRKRVPRRASIALLAALPGLLVLLAIVAASSRGDSSKEDVEALRAARDATAAPVTPAARKKQVAAILRRGQAAVKRHPVDYLPYATVGAELARFRDPRALRWLNQAMVLNPRHPGLHVVAARALRGLGRRQQALLEYREALRLETRQPVVKELVAAYPDVADLLHGVPDQPHYHRLLIDALSNAKRPDQAEAVAHRAADRWPDNPEILLRLARLDLAAKHQDGAARWARKLLAHDRRPEAWLLLGAVLSASGQKEPLVAHYQAALKEHPGHVELLVGLTGAYLTIGRLDEARTTAEKIGKRQGVTAFNLARMHDQLAQVSAADGRPHRAQWHRRQAARLRQSLRGGG